MKTEARTLVSDDYEKLYIETIKTILFCPDFKAVDNEEPDNGFYERVDFGFILTDPTKRFVWNFVRSANYDFAMKLFIWVLNGCNDFEYLSGSNKNAAKFIDDKKTNFDTAYGPRIISQIDDAILEIQTHWNSRRATIMILNKEDARIRVEDTKTEYPCAESLTFFIRENKLHCKAHMRSNNMVTTVVYDVFVFTMLQEYVWRKLIPTYPSLELGKYYHRATSAHIFEREIGLAREIIDCSIVAMRRIS